MMNQKFKVEKIIKKANRYYVYFDNEQDAILLNEDKMVEFRIYNQKIFNYEDFNKIKASQNEVKYFNKVLNYINYKPRTKKEIQTYLDNLHIDEKMSELIITKLEKMQYINDYRYTISFINEYIEKKKGKNLIIHQLEKRGIQKDLINQIIINYSSDVEYQNALEIVNKLKEKNQKFPIKKQHILAKNKLLNDGFNYDIIQRVINNIDFIDCSFDNLEKDYQKLLNKKLDQSIIIQRLIYKGYDYNSIKQIIQKENE